jgi:NAD(P)-dependent dehydrogenase (short-subunit alcohol dehydrogenase family)
MDNDMFSLKDKVAIVTGGGTGIGRSIALGFARAGANIAIGSRNLENLQKVAEEIRSIGKRVLAIKVDITKQEDIDHLVQKVSDEFGAIEILVNNAGAFSGEKLLDTPGELWDKVLSVDLRGHFLCARAVAQKMIEQKRGKIINIGSDLAIRVTVDGGAYSVAKAGVHMLTKVLSRELVDYGIRVNTIVPGWIRTKMSEITWGNPERLKFVESRIPMRRLGEPDELAGAAIFLASDASSYVTGHAIIVDGGMLDD